MSEFNLSEKIYKYANGAERMPDTIAREDVKEFIRLLKDEIGDFFACDIIDKLAGEKLI